MFNLTATKIHKNSTCDMMPFTFLCKRFKIVTTDVWIFTFSTNSF